jgi:D-alanyl-D-alanine carboxypeptidase (penicillin-binding protein 5/6)
MTLGFPSRAAICCCAVCVTGVLALPPGAAAGHPGMNAEAARTTAAPREQPAPHRPGPQVSPRPGAPKVPEGISALSWVVAEADTGDVLAARDAHRRLPPASTLKALFALTVLPSLPADIRHTVKPEELDGIGEGSSLVGIKENRTYRVADLWRGVFLSSGNDAVHVLAALNGGWRTTAAQMQAKARSLGALDTRVVSPDGYDEPGQVSSAYDLAVFGRAGLRNADFARYCATVEAEFPADGAAFPIQNTNRLLSGAQGVARYQGLIGIKNGYTSKAGSTLIAAARRDGRTLVVTVMNPQRGGGSAVYEEARSLLDWGFRAAGHVEPVGSLLPPRPAARAVSKPVPVAGEAGVEASRSGWTAAGLIAGAAGLGAAVVALVLRPRTGRAEGD